jgi:lipopolysaccharide/colanic/teichoic acid biosynthesis glycosyltransferase
LGLPKIKSGIFTPAEFNYLHSINCEQAEKTNILYAKNYSFSKDIKIIWKNIINKNIQRNEKD